ncbi:amino acid transporter [Mycoplasma testudineum]|uniref:Amino acid transporter n=1 Tax=Mycoplasma testudineum TaxID=244584 RepID=A0A4V3C2M7_9MOLU|nr:amino acid permease [Mycoplasma testudineum]OYD26487.1 hypothetical protein CG473_03820 [Mycoplasma testudineum]TDO18949.1 amino acid transporter [Mycoplasma testudineum]
MDKNNAHSKARKFGFWVALAFVVGSIIGIGIFFKNGGVSRAVEGQSITWLLSWIVGGLISLAAAISFSEISALKVNKITGISGWSHRVGGKNLGYFTTFSWSIFYWGILVTILGIFASEMFWSFIGAVGADISWIQVWHHVIFGVIISASYLLINLLAPAISHYTQTTTVVLKFIPLVIAIIVGLVFVSSTKAGSVNGFTSAAGTGQGFSFSNLILALPGVLFAFDSFLSVGSLRKDMKEDGKKLPLAIIVGMIIVVTIYTLIAIASILHTQGSIQGLISVAVPGDSSWVQAFVLFFIFVSTIGLINGLSAFILKDYTNMVETELVIGARILKKKVKAQFLGRDISKEMRGLIAIGFVFAFWFLIISVPAIVYNTDAFMDAASNWPTVFFFWIYGLVMLLYLVKKIKGHFKDEIKNANVNKYLFYVATVFAIFMIVVAEIGLIYTYAQSVVSNPLGLNSWGFYWTNNNYQPNNIIQILMYLVFGIIFLLLPKLNTILIEWIEKRNVIDELHKSAMTFA